MMARMKIDPARQRLIYGFFERYLQLNEQKEHQLMEDIKKLPNAEEIMELPISYEEKGIRKGIEKGVKKVALELLKKGSSVDFVAEVTQLNKREIERLKEEI